MKVTDEHLKIMREAIEAVDLEEYRVKYRAGDIARAESVKDMDKRYRWDLYYFAAKLGTDMPDSRYGYNMGHIDTALRAIVPLL